MTVSKFPTISNRKQSTWAWDSSPSECPHLQCFIPISPCAKCYYRNLERIETSMLIWTCDFFQHYCPRSCNRKSISVFRPIRFEKSTCDLLQPQMHRPYSVFIDFQCLTSQKRENNLRIPLLHFYSTSNEEMIGDFNSQPLNVVRFYMHTNMHVFLLSGEKSKIFPGRF